MPRRPSTPCKQNGCPKLVPYGHKYCENHKANYQLDTKSTKAKGYNAQWNKARLRYLKVHPLCVQCKVKGRLTKATVVDHIKPHRGDQELFWNQSNWQALCKSCHDRKTKTDDRYVEYTYHF
ncbi:TPA: HNH endonuclease [Streptococcus suis]|nr:HNH endonuclease [Streptococcus suis]